MYFLSKAVHCVLITFLTTRHYKQYKECYSDMSFVKPVVPVVYSQSEDWRSQEVLLGNKIFRNPLLSFELSHFNEITSSAIKL
jgi:hypothetical protein